MPDIEVLPNAEALAEVAADRFRNLSAEAISKQGLFTTVLSGGSTPLRMYNLLGDKRNSRIIEWTKVHLFWGDERCVPADHPDSNYYNVKLALLDQVPVPAQNIHRMAGELEPLQAAKKYEQELRAFFGSRDLPPFDLILLGLGDDGHTASLFPGSPELRETERWVLSVAHSTPPPPLVTRLTLTLPVLNAAKQILFLVSGAKKAEVLYHIFEGNIGKYSIPAQRINPTKGKLTWLVDQEAAQRLNKFPSVTHIKASS